VILGCEEGRGEKNKGMEVTYAVWTWISLQAQASSVQVTLRGPATHSMRPL
jgi:hypothetical protein